MMPSKGLIFLLFFLFPSFFQAALQQRVFNSSDAGIEFPTHMSFNAADCAFPSDSSALHSSKSELGAPMKLHLKRTPGLGSVFDLQARDLHRLRAHRKRSAEKTAVQQNRKLLEKKPQPPAGQLMATLESGVSLGSGEYFIDVFVGTPPRHFSLILDTGSDLNWIQCAPCLDCFDQNGPHYDPKASTSFENVSCRDPRCRLVTAPEPQQQCQSQRQACHYFYWYGDSSNSTGDFALETFTVNLTTSVGGESEFMKVENVMFGCGHWNRGLFHGAAGLLGLGRGPLSFSSQLQSLYGHSFSYCLVDRNSDPSVSSKLIFGEDRDILSHPELNYTAFLTGKQNLVDTFYYVQIKAILVGGQPLNIPEETWHVSSDGSGGTIVDSGTTLSYFAEPAYKAIKEAFMEKVKAYPRVVDFPLLDPCYNVSGVKTPLELPEFGILFEDGAVWNFPIENYFIRLEPEQVVCLAMMGSAPASALSIIGNYQQQNFHIMYDTKNSKLGFAPRRCAEV
uniref:Peptidase A1 domain-containing protein n=1 Tax=Kalanchoe fedtschenkoi TaxID=63787 RepID=A0A7N0T358_KALFE